MFSISSPPPQPSYLGWNYHQLKLLPYTNLLPPGTVIKQEGQSPGRKENDLKHLSTKTNYIGMKEGSEKYKRPKITLEGLKVNIQNGKYVSTLSKQSHLQMNEDMYTTPAIHYSYSGFHTLSRRKKSSVFDWPIKHCNQ